MNSTNMQLLRTRVTQLSSQRDMLTQALEENKARLSSAKDRIENLTKAREVIMLVGRLTQQQLEYNISNLVSLALATVFDDPYTFVVKFVERRNTVEADLLLTKGEDVYEPLESVGGGVVDVVSFALRVADWKLRGGRNFIALDEQFRNVSRDRQQKVGLLLRRLSHEFDLQIILISHQSEVNSAADKLFIVNNGIIRETAC